jgi:hypothetical protein
MIEREISEIVGKNPIIGIFGDQNFPNLSSGKSLSERKVMLHKIKKLLVVTNPKLVYLTPTKGINRCLLPALNILKIPYVVVNPYRGFFDSTLDKDKLSLLQGIESSKSVITIGKKPLKKSEEKKLELESENFIIDRSNLVISVFGKKPGMAIQNLNKRLPDAETNVIFLDYSIT